MSYWRELTFAAPGWLWVLLTLPLLALLHVAAERAALKRLAVLIASPRLRNELTVAASATRRRWRYTLLLLGLAALILTLAQPRYGFETRPSMRKGIDLLLLMDVSKSMLATDLPPNRLTRAKLAAQDLVTKLTGDRAGLVAFAGTAFLEAPLTIDYDAVLLAVNDLDVETIPRGGTNLQGAINLAVEAFGKTEGVNRAIILMSDGEATEGEATDALKAAARAKDAGVRIFTLGLGTPEGSLIPLGRGEFVKDHEGKIVRSRLDEDGLTAIAKATGGFYLRLQNGPEEMRTIAQDGLARMKAGDIESRTTRKAIERYQWPLAAALLFLAAAAFIGERRRTPARSAALVPRAATVASLVLAALVLLPSARSEEADPMSLYNDKKYDEAYQGFSELAGKHHDEDKLEFDAGASAFRGKKYDDAMNAFGHAIASPDPVLQAKSHYNLGNTLYQHGAGMPDKDGKLKDWRNAIENYNNTIALAKGPGNEPLSRDALYNRDLVQKAIDDLLKPKPTPSPSPTPTPPPDKDKKDKDDGKSQDKQKQKGQSQDKQQDKSDKGEGSGQGQDKQGNSPPPGDGQQGSPSPGENGQLSDSPPPSQGSPPPDQPRQRGDFESQPNQANSDKSAPATPSPSAGPEGGEPPEEKGKMSAAQARALLDSLRGEDEKPNLLEQKKKNEDPSVNDW